MYKKSKMQLSLKLIFLVLHKKKESQQSSSQLYNHMTVVNPHQCTMGFISTNGSNADVMW